MRGCCSYTPLASIIGLILLLVGLALYGHEVSRLSTQAWMQCPRAAVHESSCSADLHSHLSQVAIVWPLLQLNVSILLQCAKQVLL